MESWSIPKLKSELKARGFVGLTKLRKAQLVQLLFAHAQSRLPPANASFDKRSPLLPRVNPIQNSDIKHQLPKSSLPELKLKKKFVSREDKSLLPPKKTKSLISSANFKRQYEQMLFAGVDSKYWVIDKTTFVMHIRHVDDEYLLQWTVEGDESKLARLLKGSVIMRIVVNFHKNALDLAQFYNISSMHQSVRDAATPKERLLLKGLARRSLCMLIQHISAVEGFLPTTIGLEADSRHISHNQEGLIKYYESLGFKFPGTPEQMATYWTAVPMNANLADFMSRACKKQTRLV